MSRKQMHKYAVEFTERNNARAEGLTTLDVVHQIISRMAGRMLPFDKLRASRVRTEEEIWVEAMGMPSNPPKPQLTWFQR